MTTFSQNNRTRIAVVPEVTWGTTPATPAFSLLQVSSFGLNLTTNELKDQSLHADRMARYSITGNKQVGGSISLEYCNDSTTDSLIASAMKAAWATNVLITGSTDSWFSIEHGAMDNSLFSLYNGCTVAKAQIALAQNAEVKLTLDLIGHGMVASTTQVTGATYGSEPQLSPFTHFAGTIKEGGAVCGYLSAVQIDINANSTPVFALGDAYAKAIPMGMSEVTGTLTAYFQDLSLLNKFLNGTASSLDITVGDGTSTREFKMPNVKYTSATKTIASTGSVTLTCAFTALFDTTTGTNLQITKT